MLFLYIVVTIVVGVLIGLLIGSLWNSPHFKAGRARKGAVPATDAQMMRIKSGIKKLLRATAEDQVMHSRIRAMQDWIEGTRGNTGDVEAVTVMILARSDVGFHNIGNASFIFIPDTFEEVNGQPASGGYLRAAIAVFAEWQHNKTYAAGYGLDEQAAQVELDALMKLVQKRYSTNFVFPFRHGGQ